MLPDQRVGNVDAAPILQPFSSLAACVDCESLSPQAQESNAALISNADEQVQVKGKRLVPRNHPVTSSMFITQFNFVFGFVQNGAKFLAIKKHPCEDSRGVAFPDDPWGEGRNQLPFLLGLSLFMAGIGDFRSAAVWLLLPLSY